MRILLVEDDHLIGSSLQTGLQARAIAVDWVTQAEDARASIGCTPYSAMLLDIGLPDGNGISLLKWLRGTKDRTPVIIISARDDLATRVAGLDTGADDYLVKPFDFPELLARIHAVVRRHSGQATASLVCGSLRINIATHEVSYDQTSAMLPAREFALLHALAERAGTILSRQQLEEKIYGHGEEVESNAIDVLIFYIRKKFGHDVIRNVRGAGWMVLREAA